MTETFRCSAASEADGETLAGTAPSEAEWLLVEDPGPWPAKATGHLADLVGAGGRAQLIRRHGGGARDSVRTFRASLGAEVVIRTAVVDDVNEIGGLRDADYAPYDGPLWLVCTNGRRDVCCAERGRPVAAALAQRWPEETWETTHLGGHRFAATLLALPSGTTLGWVDPATAVAACAALLDGDLTLDLTRGIAGRTAAVQAAELHLRQRHGWTGLGDVEPVGHDGDRITLNTPDGLRALIATATPDQPRRQSCDAVTPKATPHWRFLDDTVG